MRIPTRAPSPFWAFSKAGPRPRQRPVAGFSCTDGCRGIAIKSRSDDRARLSKIYIPMGQKEKKGHENNADMNLVRAGFMFQSRPGMFHMLPFGLRVQKKLEALIDKYMSKLGASKVALSSISSEAAWKRSGRLDANSELFRFSDRNNHPLLLSPTHEEEITHMVSTAKDTLVPDRLPIRLYQITRKYRDEKRPRQGLLRAREFLMKDLYTFDESKSLALSTYAEVREVYARLFDELKIPYLVAEADSGAIGGNLSHEYHLPSRAGEDHVITCDGCGYTANEEVATKAAPSGSASTDGLEGAVDCWQGISKDKSTLVFVWYGSKPGTETKVNTHAIQAVFPDLDSSVENPVAHFKAQDSSTAAPKLLNIVDGTFPRHLVEKLDLKFQNYDWGNNDDGSREPQFLGTISDDGISHEPLDLLRIQNGDACSKCADGKLRVQKAIEVGHTFHLGIRYSKPLTAHAVVPAAKVQANEGDFDVCDPEFSPKHVTALMQMGCHGIGVSRIIGAVSGILADDRGLNWPRAIAPFEVMVVPLSYKPEDGTMEDAEKVYDILSSVSQVGQTPVDVVLDDRSSKSFPWKMNDADMVGYPIIVVLGRRWKERVVEVQCRRLKFREEVPVGELLGCVRSLLDRL